MSTQDLNVGDLVYCLISVEHSPHVCRVGYERITAIFLKKFIHILFDFSL